MLETNIFFILVGFDDWADSLTEEEQERYICDASVPDDIERWFSEIIYPSLKQKRELALPARTHYLSLVDEGDFDEIAKQQSSDLSPVPFTRDPTLRDAFFLKIAQLLRDKKYEIWAEPVSRLE